MTERIDLYRCFDGDGVLLYVGISHWAWRRIAEHRDYMEWFSRVETITIERFPTKDAALEAESAAIRREGPLHNESMGRALHKVSYKRRQPGAHLGRPRKYPDPTDEQRRSLMEWWIGPMHTDDVSEFAGKLLKCKPVPRPTLAEWLGPRPKCKGRHRKTRSDKKQN